MTIRRATEHDALLRAIEGPTLPSDLASACYERFDGAKAGRFPRLWRTLGRAIDAADRRWRRRPVIE